MIRDHVSYLRYDRVRYEGHTNIPTKNQRAGLSDTTVNIRLRTLKAIFNQMERDELIGAGQCDKESEAAANPNLRTYREAAATAYRGESPALYDG